MRKIIAPNPYKEITHPIHDETLSHIILPEDLVALDKSQAESLYDDNFVVVLKEDGRPIRITPELFFNTIGGEASSVLGVATAATTISKSPEERQAECRAFYEDLLKQASPAEIELLFFHNQFMGTVVKNLIQQDAERQEEVPQWSRQDARYFRGEDGSIYFESVQSAPVIAGKMIPGQVKAVYRLTINGPELAYLAASNNALKRLLLEKDVEINDALVQAAVGEEEAFSGIAARRLESAQLPKYEIEHNKKRYPVSIITDDMLTGSLNPAVKELESHGWIHKNDAPFLHQIVQDGPRSRLFRNQDSSFYDKKTLSQNLLKMGFTQEEIISLQGYSQNPEGWLLHLLNSGNVRGPLSARGEAGIHNLATEFSAVEKLTFVRNFVRVKERMDVQIYRDISGRLTLSIDYPIMCTASTNQANARQALLLPIRAYFAFLPDGSGMTCLHLEMPDIYRPLLFSNSKYDFDANYEKLMGKPLLELQPSLSLASESEWKRVGQPDLPVSEILFALAGNKNRATDAFVEHSLITTFDQQAGESLGHSIPETVKDVEFSFSLIPPKGRLSNNTVYCFFDKTNAGSYLAMYVDSDGHQHEIVSLSTIQSVEDVESHDSSVRSERQAEVTKLATEFYRTNAWRQSYIDSEPDVDLYKETASKAWTLGLTDDEIKQVKAVRHNIDERCAADPRLVLLFKRRSYVTNETYHELEQISNLLGESYPSLAVLWNDLKSYGDTLYSLKNADRQKTVFELLKKVRDIFYGDDELLPPYLEEPLSRLKQELSQELDYLKEVAEIRVAESADPDHLLPDLAVPALAKTRDRVKSDPDLALKKAIFKSFKAANKTPLPTPKKLDEYAKQIKETEKILKEVEAFIQHYLMAVHKIQVEDEGYSRPFIRKNGHSSLSNLNFQHSNEQAKKGHSKLLTCVLMLNKVENFREEHGKPDSRNETVLHDIDEYKAVIDALREILDNNDREKHFWQGNRFSKGGFSYIRARPLALDSLVSIKSPSHAAELRNDPSRHVQEKGMRGILGKKPKPAPKENVVFSLHLASTFSFFERSEFNTQQEARKSWFFRKLTFKTALESTASEHAVVYSGKFLEECGRGMAAAESVEDLDAVRQRFIAILKPELNSDSDQSTPASEAAPVPEPAPTSASASVATQDSTKVDPDVWLRDAYKRRDLPRIAGYDHLQFLYDICKKQIECKKDVEVATTVEAIQDAQLGFESALDVLNRESAKGKPYETIMGENLRFIKQRHRRICEVKVAKIRKAKAQYANKVLLTVSDSIAELNKLGAAEVADLEDIHTKHPICTVMESAMDSIAQQHQQLIREIEAADTVDGLDSKDQKTINAQAWKTGDDVKERALLAVLDSHARHVVTTTQEWSVKHDDISALVHGIEGARGQLTELAKLASRFGLSADLSRIDPYFIALGRVQEAREYSIKGIAKANALRMCFESDLKVNVINELPGLLALMVDRLKEFDALGLKDSSDSKNLKSQLISQLTPIAIDRVVVELSGTLNAEFQKDRNDLRDIPIVLKAAREQLKKLVPAGLKTSAITEYLKQMDRDLVSAALGLDPDTVTVSSSAASKVFIEALLKASLAAHGEAQILAICEDIQSVVVTSDDEVNALKRLAKEALERSVTHWILQGKKAWDTGTLVDRLLAYEQLRIEAKSKYSNFLSEEAIDAVLEAQKCTILHIPKNSDAQDGKQKAILVLQPKLFKWAKNRTNESHLNTEVYLEYQREIQAACKRFAVSNAILSNGIGLIEGITNLIVDLESYIANPNPVEQKVQSNSTADSPSVPLSANSSAMFAQPSSSSSCGQETIHDVPLPPSAVTQSVVAPKNCQLS